MTQIPDTEYETIPPEIFESGMFVYESEWPPEDLMMKPNELHYWVHDGETFLLKDGIWVRVAKQGCCNG